MSLLVKIQRFSSLLLTSRISSNKLKHITQRFRFVALLKLQLSHLHSVKSRNKTTICNGILYECINFIDFGALSTILFVKLCGRKPYLFVAVLSIRKLTDDIRNKAIKIPYTHHGLQL